MGNTHLVYMSFPPHYYYFLCSDFIIKIFLCADSNEFYHVILFLSIGRSDSHISA